MKVFLICPVCNITDLYRADIDAQVEHLEKVEGHTVYYPPRDTNQDASSLAICEQNRDAIERTDKVLIIWDGKSQGCLFDLGMAFALGKRVEPVTGYFPVVSGRKSFQNMVYEYAG